jgi:hypothetical protein
MSLRIDEFKSKLVGGGARPNLFRCIINSPGVASGVPSELTTFMCKGAALPASVIANIDVPFRGRQLKVAGDRTFENWTATIFNETSFAVRDSFERWMNSINGHASGVAASTNPADYQAQIIVDQLDRTNSVIKSYTIEGAFPVNVSAIELAYDTNDTIEEFTVEFAYQYWSARNVS